MSKLLKYTKGFDNNPNSDIGASKRVVKEYKKLLAKEQLKPIIQEMNNQTKSVVTNLNDYSLLLKSITQNLVNADLYLTNPEVSKSKGSGRYTGGGLSDKERLKIMNTASKKGITTKAQALNHIQETYRNKPAGTKMTQGDKNIIKAFGLGNIRATTDAVAILGKIGNNEVVNPVTDVDIPEVLDGYAPKKGTPIANQIIQMGENPLLSSVSELRSRNSSPYASEVSSPQTPSSRFGIGSRRASMVSSKLSALVDAEKAFGLSVGDLDSAFEGERYSNTPQSTLMQDGLQQNEDDADDFDYDETYGENEGRDDELNQDDFGYSGQAAIPVVGGDDDGGDDDINFENLIKNRENNPIQQFIKMMVMMVMMIIMMKV